MIYAKVDVKLRDHVRAHKAGVAMATWLWALLYVREQETDGVVPEIALKLSWAGEKEARRHADQLVLVGLWERHDDGWRICRYEAKNETAAAIAERRLEAAERMRRVRANRLRTSSEHHPNVRSGNSDAVPGSGSGSGFVSEKIPEEISPRARVANPSDPPPDWWADVIETIAMKTGVRLPAEEAWLRYAGHRGSDHKRMPANRNDAIHWLTTVMVKEARAEREKRRREAEWDAKYDRTRAGPGTITESLPDESPEEVRARCEEIERKTRERKARERGAA